ncbi:MAG: AMP-binding protein [bacterium]|nr:AMP-binding protein [bacterium]
MSSLGTLDRIIEFGSDAEKMNRIALISDSQRWTYYDLKNHVDLFSGFLLNNGLQKGDRVMVFLPNCPKFVITYLGTINAGGVMAALNPRHSQKELLYVAKDIHPKFFITLRDFAELNREIIKVLPPDCKVMIVDLASDLPVKLRLLYRLKNLFKRPRSGHFRWRDIVNLKNLGVRTYRDGCGNIYPVQNRPEDLAVLQFTGGTTGNPKTAMLTHDNLASNADQALAVVSEALNKDSVMYGGLPCFHIFALACLNMALMRGATFVLDLRPSPDTILKLIPKHRINLLPGIPKLFAGMLKSPKFAKTDFSSLKLCVSGAGALDVSVKQEFERAAECEIIEGYGLSETSPVVCINPIGRGRPGTLGIPVQDTEIRIEEDGELWVRGPQVMLGYWRNNEESGKAFAPGGWFKTGDMVRQDGEYLILTDRKKDMVKVSGENIFPSEIEGIIRTHPDVGEVAVVGVPDRDTGERIVACIVLKAGSGGITEAELMAFFVQAFGNQRLKRPKQILILKELPKNFLGKVLKKELRKMIS